MTERQLEPCKAHSIKSTQQQQGAQQPPTPTKSTRLYALKTPIENILSQDRHAHETSKTCAYNSTLRSQAQSHLASNEQRVTV